MAKKKKRPELTPEELEIAREIGRRNRRLNKKLARTAKSVRTKWAAEAKAKEEFLRSCWIASGGDPDVFRSGIKGPLPDRTREATAKGRIEPEPAAPISEEELRIRQLSLQADNISELLDGIEEGMREMLPKSQEQWPSLEEEFWDGHKRSMESIEEFLRGWT